MHFLTSISSVSPLIIELRYSLIIFTVRYVYDFCFSRSISNSSPDISVSSSFNLAFVCSVTIPCSTAAMRLFAAFKSVAFSDSIAFKLVLSALSFACSLYTESAILSITFLSDSIFHVVFITISSRYCFPTDFRSHESFLRRLDKHE